MSRKRLGMTAVVDADDRLLGLYTDGDLRRSLTMPASTCAMTRIDADDPRRRPSMPTRWRWKPPS